MTDAASRLNAALEGRYTIERELGEGGMATVLHDMFFADSQAQARADGLIAGIDELLDLLEVELS
jgi:hypothetical protein